MLAGTWAASSRYRRRALRILNVDRSLAVIGAIQTALRNYTAPILEILQTRFMPRHKRECSADHLRDEVLWATCSHSQPFFVTEISVGFGFTR